LLKAGYGVLVGEGIENELLVVSMLFTGGVVGVGD